MFEWNGLINLNDYSGNQSHHWQKVLVTFAAVDETLSFQLFESLVDFVKSCARQFLGKSLIEILVDVEDMRGTRRARLFSDLFQALENTIEVKLPFGWIGRPLASVGRARRLIVEKLEMSRIMLLLQLLLLVGALHSLKFFVGRWWYRIDFVQDRRQDHVDELVVDVLDADAFVRFQVELVLVDSDGGFDHDQITWCE